ncbi:aminotransferase-like domain-containing protein [Sinorhizobium medicae]|uniref:aminotransferase-like domain-containing protein n=1 Tax=Sinorhizobium medicae TaxID=110321 RepID=UPI0021A72F16|nr:PLP-dependent aminotransferase family protein [Sinorhizobium medicae]UWU12455.1 PLP-dependent aminotransferase family protein [Sinorhizobium medicae]
MASALAFNLIPASPPIPDWAADRLNHTLSTLADHFDLFELLKVHRFQGTELDRKMGATWLAPSLREEVDPDRVVLTNGGQNGIFMLLDHLVGRGGVLVTEELSYHGIHRYAEILGIQLVSIPMDTDGALPDALEFICKKEAVKAVFLMPTLHNPTSIVMSLERRQDLVRVARKHGVTIIEDHVYSRLVEEAPPPFASIAPECSWYVSGLAKTVGTGLRVGYLAAPSPEAARQLIKPNRTMSTWFVSPLSAAIANEWIHNGTAEEILKGIREETTARQMLVERYMDGIDHTAHRNGIQAWLTVPRKYDLSSFVKSAAESGVLLHGADEFVMGDAVAPARVRICVGKPNNREDLASALGILRTLLTSE